MRRAVAAFYVALVAYIFLVGGPKTGFVIVGAIVGLLIAMRPIEAGRAIKLWSRLRFRGRRTSTSS